LLVSCAPNQAPKSALQRRRLQFVHSSDRAIAFEVFAKFQLKVTPAYDYERVTVEDLSIVVMRHDVRSGVVEPVFTQDHPALSITTSTGPPLWETRFILAPEFVLPSARVVEDENNRFWLLLFDGEAMHSRVFDPSGRRFIEQSLVMPPPEALADAFVFAMDDVYWSYALLCSGEFFGMVCEKPSFSRGAVDLSELYELWRRAQKVDGH